MASYVLPIFFFVVVLTIVSATPSDDELGCEGDPNAEYSRCPGACPPTCADPKPEFCTMQCVPHSCVCKPGYILSAKDGNCIEPKDCPELGCGGDPNAEYNRCPSACPPTCADPNPEICTMQCVLWPHSCVCKPGYILSAKDGNCIEPKDCPEP